MFTNVYKYRDYEKLQKILRRLTSYFIYTADLQFFFKLNNRFHNTFAKENLIFFNSQNSGSSICFVHSCTEWLKKIIILFRGTPYCKYHILMDTLSCKCNRYVFWDTLYCKYNYRILRPINIDKSRMNGARWAEVLERGGWECYNF